MDGDIFVGMATHRICPATGHLVSTHAHSPSEVRGGPAPPPPYCPNHGVKLFETCRVCGKPWPLIAESYSSQPTGGARFCRECSAPAPWLQRADLMMWVRHQVQASGDLTDAARAELVAILDRLKDMDPSDEKAVPGWTRLRELAPKVYAATKPVRDVLIGEVVKRALGL